MLIAAIPDYLARHINADATTASPGLRFGYYLNIWNADWSKARGLPDSTRKSITHLNTNDVARQQALAARQDAQADAQDDVLTLDALATAAFATGLGNEHPTENGFAFLKPYGLPYLPGSSIKGVLRQAARELASGEWGDTAGWSDTRDRTFEVNDGAIPLSTIDALFGRETDADDTDQLRGALSFWDAIPKLRGDTLAIDVMTPHQSHYYQNGETPHDSGQPVPIPFLTVPPGSAFTFHVQCNMTQLERTARDLARDDQWQTLLTAAFEHAFDWCGFGAKTAVGYGAMTYDESKQDDRRAAEEQQLEADRQREAEAQRLEEIAQMDPVDKAIAEFLDNRPTKDTPENRALGAALKAGHWDDDDLTRPIAEKVKQRMQTEGQWREESKKKTPRKDKLYVLTQDILKILSN